MRGSLEQQSGEDVLERGGRAGLYHWCNGWEWPDNPVSQVEHVLWLVMSGKSSALTSP